VAIIPKALHEHINSAFPANVCLIASVLPNGFAQVSPRGSAMVYDDDHLALWERGKGSVNASLTDGTKVTVFLRKIALRESGLLPKGGIARFYGTAKIYGSGPVYEEIWKRLVQPEKDRDPHRPCSSKPNRQAPMYAPRKARLVKHHVLLRCFRKASR
jgi:hypothetical protein